MCKIFPSHMYKASRFQKQQPKCKTAPIISNAISQSAAFLTRASLTGNNQFQCRKRAVCSNATVYEVFPKKTDTPKHLQPFVIARLPLSFAPNRRSHIYICHSNPWTRGRPRNYQIYEYKRLQIPIPLFSMAWWIGKFEVCLNGFTQSCHGCNFNITCVQVNQSFFDNYMKRLFNTKLKKNKQIIKKESRQKLLIMKSLKSNFKYILST